MASSKKTTNSKNAKSAPAKTKAESSTKRSAPAPAKESRWTRPVGAVVCLLLALCVAVSYFNADGLLLALMAALAAVTAAAAAMGYARAEFVPAVYIAGSNTLLGAAGLITWAVLLLLPTILHLWEDMTWRILRSKM